MPDYTYERANQTTSGKNVVDDSGNVYFEDGDGNLKSIDNTGTVRWTATDLNGDGSALDDWAISPDNTELVVLVDGSSWYFVDAGTGNVNASTATTFQSTTSMVCVSNTREIYINEYTGPLHHYDAGADTSTKAFNPPNGSAEAETQHIAYNANHVYLGDNSGYIYELNRSDFSINQSTQVATFGVEVQDVSDDGSFIQVNGYDGANSEGQYWGYDGSLNELYNFTYNGAFDVAYDSVDGESYTPGGGQDTIQTYDQNGTKRREYTDASGDVEDIVINEAYNASKTIINRGFGEIAQIDDSEFTKLIETVTTTQVSTPATMNGATAQIIEPITSTQVAGAGTMNTTTLVENFRIDTTTVSTAATPNGATATDIPRIPATQASTSTSMLAADTLDVENDWVIVDVDGVKHRANGIALDEGVPAFRRGRELQRTFIFNRAVHTKSYNALKEKFNQYIGGETVKVVQTYDGKPHYTQNINPRSPTESYLWKLEPTNRFDSWWVVVTDIQDSTRQIGPAEALTVTMYVIAPVSEGDRAYIEDNFEV